MELTFIDQIPAGLLGSLIDAIRGLFSSLLAGCAF